MDTQTAIYLGTVAETCAQWLKDNPQKPEELDLNEPLDLDEHGLRVLATGYMRLFYECVKAGIIKPGNVQ